MTIKTNILLGKAVGLLILAFTFSSPGMAMQDFAELENILKGTYKPGRHTHTHLESLQIFEERLANDVGNPASEAAVHRKHIEDVLGSIIKETDWALGDSQRVVDKLKAEIAEREAILQKVPALQDALRRKKADYEGKLAIARGTPPGAAGGAADAVKAAAGGKP